MMTTTKVTALGTPIVTPTIYAESPASVCSAKWFECSMACTPHSACSATWFPASYDRLSGGWFGSPRVGTPASPRVGETLQSESFRSEGTPDSGAWFGPRTRASSTPESATLFGPRARGFSGTVSPRRLLFD